MRNVHQTIAGRISNNNIDKVSEKKNAVTRRFLPQVDRAQPQNRAYVDKAKALHQYRLAVLVALALSHPNPHMFSLDLFEHRFILDLDEMTAMPDDSRYGMKGPTPLRQR